MKRLQEAQEKVTKITVTFMTINCLLAKMADDNNNIKQFGEQITQIGNMLDSTAGLLGEVAGNIAAAAPDIIQRMAMEGRFE